MKKRLFAILISLVICLTFTLTACDKISVQSVEKDPTNQVIVSSADTVKSAAKTLSPFYALSQASKKGRFTININDSEAGDLFSGDLYIDRQNITTASYLKLGLGETGTIDLTLYEDREGIVIGSESLLDGNYGINYQTLRSDLESSGIWDMFGIDSSEFMDTWGEFADALSELYKDTDAAIKGTKDFGDKVANKVKNILNETLPEVKKDKIDIEGESVSAITVTYNITEKTIGDIITAVCNCYKEFLSTDGFGKYVRAYMSAALSISGTDYTVENAIDEMRGEIVESLEDVTFNGTVCFALNPKTADIMNINLSGTETDEFDTKTEYKANIMLGKSLDKSEEYVIDLSDTCDGETNTYMVKIKRSDTENGEFSRIITVNTNNGDAENIAFECGFVLERSDNTFKLYVLEDGSKTEISGTMTYSETEIDMTFDGLKKDGEVSEMPKIKLEVRAGDDVPAKPESLNILKLDTEELQTFISNVYTNIAPYFFPIGYSDENLYDYDYDYDLSDLYSPEYEEYQAIIDYSETYDYDGDGDCGDEDDYTAWEFLNSYFV